MEETATNKTSKKKKVEFGTVEIRLHSVTLGDNPAVSIGPPVCLRYDDDDDDDDDKNDKTNKKYTSFLEPAVPVEEYERTRRGKRRKPQSQQLKLNYYQRYEILHEAGFDDTTIQAAERTVSWVRTKRKASYYYCYPYIYAGDVKAQWGRRRTKRFLRQQKQSNKSKTRKSS